MRIFLHASLPGGDVGKYILHTPHTFNTGNGHLGVSEPGQDPFKQGVFDVDLFK